MPFVDWATTMIGYTEWANARVLAAAEAASTGALSREIGPGAGTVAEGLFHTAEVQMWWFSVIDGRGDQYEPPDETTDLAAIKALFAASTAEMNGFAAQLTEEALESPVRATHPSGAVHSWPAWQILSHLVNHSTHHRAEIGRALGNLGHSPGDLDLLFYLARD